MITSRPTARYFAGAGWTSSAWRSTPGIDFDPAEGHRYARFSYAGATDDMAEAMRRLQGWAPSPREPGCNTPEPNWQPRVPKQDSTAANSGTGQLTTEPTDG